MAFFYTDGSPRDSAFNEMESLCGKKPLATLMLRGKQEVKSDYYVEKTEDFVSKIKAD